MSEWVKIFGFASVIYKLIKVKVKVKISLFQAVEAHTVAGG
jgi:hypothetical protein